MPGSTDSNDDSVDMSLESRIIQITNIAPQASREQIQAMFGIIGKLEDLKLYPSMQTAAVRICFLKFMESDDVAPALSLSNTVFIDRALVVIPYATNELPDEAKGLEILSSVNSFGILEPKLPPTLTNQVEGVPPHQMIRTLDPRLSMHNLPVYPLLPASTDPRRLEEIRRTLIAVNIDPALTEKQVIQHFTSAGEVKYMRFCTKKGDESKYAMIEFVEQESIVPALKLNNKKLGNNTIKVTHSTQAIIKPVPQNKSNEAAQKEIEEEVNRVKEAQQSLLPPVVLAEEIQVEKEKEKPVPTVEKAPVKAIVEKTKDKEVKKSRSRSRSRSKSRSRRRSSSRSRRRKDRSRSRKRSRSRSRKRTRSRSRSRSRDRRKRSRSRSRDRRKKSRSRERRRRTRSRSRSRKKSPRPSRDRGRDRSKERTKDKDKDRVEKTKEKKDRTKDKERKEKKKDKKEKKERLKSPSSKESSDEKGSTGGRRSPKSPSPLKSKGRRRSRSVSRERSC